MVAVRRGFQNPECNHFHRAKHHGELHTDVCRGLLAGVCLIKRQTAHVRGFPGRKRYPPLSPPLRKQETKTTLRNALGPPCLRLPAPASSITPQWTSLQFICASPPQPPPSHFPPKTKAIAPPPCPPATSRPNKKTSPFLFDGRGAKLGAASRGDGRLLRVELRQTSRDPLKTMDQAHKTTESDQ